MRYRAFLSYSRQDDAAAGWLHKRLERYKVPSLLVATAGSHGPVPASLHPIYRDRTDSSGGGQLAHTIEQHLLDSEALIVLCSPAAVSSPWVDREIRFFIEHHGEARIFPVIGPNLPNSDDVERDFFPVSLRGRGLLAADLRQIRLASGQVVGDGLEVGRLKLIAGLLGVHLDLLTQRERQRQRRLIAGLATAAVLFAVVAVVAVLSTLAATRRRIEAATNLTEARRSQSRFLTDLAREALGEGRVTDSIALALNAVPNRRSDWPYLSAAERVLYEANLTLVVGGLKSLYTLRGHADSIVNAAYSGDGKQIATWSADWSARTWNADDGSPRLTLQHEGPVRAAFFAANDSQLVTASTDGFIRLWSTGDGRLLRSFRHDGPVLGVTSTVDGSHLLSYAGDGTARMWSVTQSEPLFVLSHPGTVIGAALVSDERRILTWTREGLITLWDRQTRAPVSTRRLTAGLESILVDGARNIAFIASNRLERWDLSTGTSAVLADGGLLAFVKSPGSGPFAVIDGKGVAQIRSEAAGTLLARITHDYPVRSAEFSPDGRSVATWSTDGVIQIWTLDPVKLQTTLPTQADVVGVRFIANGRVIWWSVDGQIQVVDAASGEELGRGKHETHVPGVIVSHGGDRLLTWSDDGEAHLWDLPPSWPRHQIGPNDPGNTGRIGDQLGLLNFDANSSLAIQCRSGNDVRLREVGRSTDRHVLRHDEDVTFCMLSEDGGRALTLGRAGLVRLWNTGSGALERTLNVRVPVLLALSPGGDRLVVRDAAAAVTLFDALSGRTLGSWRGRSSTSTLLAGNTNRVVVFEAADGVRMIDWDGRELPWPVKTSDLVLHTLTPDTSKLVAIEAGRTVHVVDLQTGTAHTSAAIVGEIVRVNPASDGMRLIVRTKEKRGYWLDLKTSREPIELTAAGSVAGVQIAPDGGTVTILNDSPQQVLIWRLEEEKPFTSVPLEGPQPNAYFSADSRWLTLFTFREIKVFDLERGVETMSYYNADGIVPTFPITANGRLFATTPLGSLVVHNVATGEKLVDYSLAGAEEFQLTKRGDYLYSSRARLIIPVWNNLEELQAASRAVMSKDASLSAREQCRAFMKTDCPVDVSLPIYREIARNQKLMKGHVGSMIDLVDRTASTQPLSLEVGIGSGGLMVFYDRPFRGSVVRAELHKAERRFLLVMEDGRRRDFGLGLMRQISLRARGIGHASFVQLSKPDQVPKEEFSQDQIVRFPGGTFYARSGYTVPVFFRD